MDLIIPCFNEEAVIPLLADELQQFEKDCPYAVNFIFIDDGSSDQTFSLLKNYADERENYQVIAFSRNFGHQVAVTAGLDASKADVVGVIDADLQDPPSVLLDMLKKWKEGYEVVYGVRQNRKEGFLLRASYSLFYRMLKKVSNVDLPLDAGDFGLMDRKVVDQIKAMSEHNRYIRGLRGWVGFRQIGFPYERKARQAGVPKYNFSKLMKLAFDGLVTFSSLPLRLSAWIGALSSILGFFYVIYAVFQYFSKDATPSGWTSLVVLFIFFGGIQLLVLGIVGEYLGRIFDEVKNRPHYIVRERVNFER